jgi:hypothetical protein
MIKHKPITLNPAQRADLGSITRHPGMDVLVEVIMAGHLRQQEEAVHQIAPDDPDRIKKIDAICSVSYAMKLNLDLVRQELHSNWMRLESAAAQARLKAGAEENARANNADYRS